MKKPTFLLKPSAYKTNELYAIIPTDASGDMNVSGYVGNGTRVNKDGLVETVATDTPRIDYHKGTGLLVEPTRTNLVDYSVTLQDWTNFNAVTKTTEAGIAPDGTKTAIFLEDDRASHSEYILDGTGYTVGDATAIHTLSVFAKKSDIDSFLLYVRSAPTTSYQAYVRCSFDGTTEVAADPNSIVVSSGSEKYSGGWYRFYIVVDMDNTDTVIRPAVFPFTNLPGGSPDIDDMGSVWIWGAQLEQGSYMTSYIPTSAATAARTADTVTALDVVTTGGFLTLGNGAIFIDGVFEDHTPDTTSPIAFVGTAGGSVRILYASAASSAYPKVRVVSTDTTTDDFTFTQRRNRVLFNMSPTGVDVWVNGTKEISTAKDFFLTDEDLTFTGAPSKWKLLESAIFKSKLTDAESQAITQ